MIAVSGAGGFVGRHLCQELSARGEQVRPVSRADLTSQELVAMLNGTTTFVHLAARVHVLAEHAADPRAEFRRSNVELTRAAALASTGAGVKRFVFISSAGVLGASSPREGFREDSAPHPHDEYTASKLEAEECLRCELGAETELVILRPPLIYGPGARGNLMRLLRFALKGWPLPLGALRAPRSLIGVRNLCDLMGRLATSAHPVAGTMLVADREVTSVADLYRSIAACAGHHPWLAPLPPAIMRLMLRMAGRRADVARLTDAFLLHPRIAQDRFGWYPPHSQQAEIEYMIACEARAASVAA